MKNIMILIAALSLGCKSSTGDNVEDVKHKTEGGESIQIGEIIYGGNGCPEESVVIEGDRKNNSLNLIFEKYTVSAGLGEGKLARKSCNLALPITVPQGLQIGIVSAEFKGFASLPENATARITTEYFSAGEEGVVRNEEYVGTLEEEISISHSALDDGAIVWTPCGQDTNLRMNSRVLLNTNESDEEAVLSLDQASLIQLVVRECQDE